jgi:hypothetical protein
MTQFDPNQQFQQRMAPPTDMGQFIIPPQPSSWPKVIGIIAIVLGSLATLGGLLGAASSYITEWGLSMMPAEARTAAMTETIVRWRPWLVATSLCSAAVAVLLIVAGARLVNRRPSAPGLCRNWAILKMIVVLFVAAVTYHVQREQFANVPPAGTRGMPAGMPAMMAVFSAAFGVLWGWALPVFMLIWFARRKIKEEVAEWY